MPLSNNPFLGLYPPCPALIIIVLSSSFPLKVGSNSLTSAIILPFSSKIGSGRDTVACSFFAILLASFLNAATVVSFPFLKFTVVLLFETGNPFSSTPEISPNASLV